MLIYFEILFESLFFCNVLALKNTQLLYLHLLLREIKNCFLWLQGYDNSIGIPKNLLSEEIQLVLHVHFHKICKSNFPLHSIVITLVDPIELDEYTNLSSIFTNSLASENEMITRIVNVFPKFDKFPTADKINISQGLITIPYEYLRVFLKPYRTSLPLITKFR